MSLRHLRRWEAQWLHSRESELQQIENGELSADELLWPAGSTRMSRFSLVCESDSDEAARSEEKEGPKAPTNRLTGATTDQTVAPSSRSDSALLAPARSGRKSGTSNETSAFRGCSLLDGEPGTALRRGKTKRPEDSTPARQSNFNDHSSSWRKFEGADHQGDTETAGRASLPAGRKLERAATTFEADLQVPYCLFTPRWVFDWENEFSDLFGRNVSRTTSGRAFRRCGLGRGDSVTRRHKFWLCQSSPEWPTVIDGLRMACSNEQDYVEFYLYPSKKYLETREVLDAVVASHDPQNLQAFLRRHPFHVEGLLALADTFQNSGQPEPAFELLKRALHSLQCGFHPKFVPFTSLPNTKLQLSVDPRRPENLPLFKSFLLYMLGLGAQGCNRAALATCQLLIRMDHETDSCHALLHFHHYAVNSGMQQSLWNVCRHYVPQHLDLVVALNNTAESLQSTSIVSDFRPWCLSDLSIMLPNFAFTIALAVRKKNTAVNDLDSFRRVKILDLVSVITDEPLEEEHLLGQFAAQLPHVLLARALLLFPSFLVTILTKLNCRANDIPSGTAYTGVSWGDLLFSPPIKRSSEPFHKLHGAVLKLLVACYVEKTHELWRPEHILGWLHSCAAHLRYLFQTDLDECKKLNIQIERWRGAAFALDVERYRLSRPSEFSRDFVLPDFLLNKKADRNVDRQLSSAGDSLVSLKSHPIVVFCQTLLPWNELDHSGLRAPPVSLTRVIQLSGSFTWSFVKAVFSLVQDVLKATLSKLLTTEMG